MIGSLKPGADILFARAALAERLTLQVLLPCNEATFRKTYIANAAEPWISDYDRIVTTYRVTVEDAGLTVDDTLERRHNIALLDKAESLGRDNDQRVWLLTIRPTPLPASPNVFDDLMARAEDRGILAVDFAPLPAAALNAFVVMPYGKKKDPRANRIVNCDAAFHRVYRPLLEDFDIDWNRADLQTDSGIIHSGMLADLANSDLVLADLSAINFNVAYEVGVRHVFASRATVLIDPKIASFKRAAPPFDINLIRTHSFARAADDVTDEQAEAGIRELRPVVATALSGTGADSPCHEWFSLGHIRRPFQRLANLAQFQVADKEIRDRVASAVRSADAGQLREVANEVAQNQEISDAGAERAGSSWRLR